MAISTYHTKVSLSKTGSKSLKTTIPFEIVDRLGIKLGDELEWSVVVDAFGVRALVGVVSKYFNKKIDADFVLNALTRIENYTRERGDKKEADMLKKLKKKYTPPA